MSFWITSGSFVYLRITSWNLRVDCRSIYMWMGFIRPLRMTYIHIHLASVCLRMTPQTGVNAFRITSENCVYLRITSGTFVVIADHFIFGWPPRRGSSQLLRVTHIIYQFRLLRITSGNFVYLRTISGTFVVTAFIVHVTIFCIYSWPSRRVIIVTREYSLPGLI